MSERAQRFLLEASRELVSSLDFEETLRCAARLMVPTLCDGCAVYVSEDGRLARRVEVAHSDPAMRQLAQELVARHAASPDPRYGVARVMQTGRSELAPEITDEFLVRAAIDAEHLRVLRALKMRSSMIVPLRVRDRVFGALSLASDVSGRVFGPADLAVAEDFALRTAIAVENAMLYREAQRAVALAEDEARRRDELIAALERTNDELDRFAYVTSHDLRAPLRNVASLAEFVAEDLGADLPPQVRGHLLMLRRRVKGLEELVDGILSYSRAKEQGDASEDVDVGALVAEVAAMLGAAGEGAAVTVGEGMPVLRTARVPLQRVFLNLVGNALKHGARPGSAPRVTVTVRDAYEHWEFAVSDEGPGVAPRDQARVWGMFQTASREGVEGTGVGLAVVRRIVAACGGEAWLESEEALGAHFHFTWPKR